jgi:hypothetical protein
MMILSSTPTEASMLPLLSTPSPGVASFVEAPGRGYRDGKPLDFAHHADELSETEPQ